MAKADDLQQLLARVQDYVDGTMPRREAVEFYLRAQKSRELAAEIEKTKALFSQLDALDHEQPGPRFDDAAILRSIPYDHYQSAPLPLHLWPVVQRVPFLARWLRRTSRAALAAGSAYLLVLLTGHSFLASSTERLARAVDGRLESWVAQSREMPVLSGVVSAISALYDGLALVVGGMAALFGTPLVTLALGFTLGALAWSAAGAVRRRRQAARHLV